MGPEQVVAEAFLDSLGLLLELVEVVQRFLQCNHLPVESEEVTQEASPLAAVSLRGELD